MALAQVSAESTWFAGRSVGGIGALAADISIACFEPEDARSMRIKAALQRAAADPGFLDAEQRLPAAGCYARHVLYSDPSGRFTILAIVWGPGQFSAPHAHQTWCAYAVHDNALQETIFDWNPEKANAFARQTSIREPGYACYAGAGLDQIHKLGNPGSTPAISIHVYGVERDRIATHVNRPVEMA